MLESRSDEYECMKEYFPTDSPPHFYQRWTKATCCTCPSKRDTVIALATVEMHYPRLSSHPLFVLRKRSEMYVNKCNSFCIEEVNDPLPLSMHFMSYPPPLPDCLSDAICKKAKQCGLLSGRFNFCFHHLRWHWRKQELMFFFYNFTCSLYLASKFTIRDVRNNFV